MPLFVTVPTGATCCRAPSLPPARPQEHPGLRLRLHPPRTTRPLLPPHPTPRRMSPSAPCWVLTSSSPSPSTLAHPHRQGQLLQPARPQHPHALRAATRLQHLLARPQGRHPLPVPCCCVALLPVAHAVPCKLHAGNIILMALLRGWFLSHLYCEQ